MRVRRREKLVAEINITPFTDVILVLLVIFMIATPLIFQSSMKVHLPDAESAEASTETIIITVNETGEAFLDNTQYNLRYDFGMLKSRLRSLLGNNANPSVIINGDKNARYEFVVRVIDLVSQLGANPILLGTAQKKE
ncbi:MAG: biopolymer transporter ExbD [Candidatus Omnitrophica bacterium]|nr:biopolymer transporter ExbD [Candidatus Omnitrophota bacterium]